MRDRPILVVEDDADVADVMGEVLKETGCSVLFAADGPSALQLAGVENPCLILLDLTLPGMSGWQVLEGLRRIPALAGTRIVVCSADNGSQLSPIAQAHGVELLLKPFNLDDLYGLVEGCKGQPAPL